MSEETTTKQEVPETEMRNVAFDAYACHILEQAHALIASQCPEVRSIASVLDYYGQLNDAQVRKGVWTDASTGRTPLTVEGVLGSMFQTLRLLDDMMNQGVALAGQLREHVYSFAAENQRLIQENERLQKEIEERGTKGPAPVEFETPVA